MTLLIFALLVLIITALAFYLADLFPLDGRLALAAKAIILVIAILLIASKAGLV